MNVLVNGIGNIGTTLLNLLEKFKYELSINHIYALKNTTVTDWVMEDLSFLTQKGIVICTKNSNTNNRIKITLDDVIKDIDYIFDCTSNGFGLQNKIFYKSLTNLKGVCTQGSEKGFGIPFMTSINNDVIWKEKFVQIVSCNTHSITSLLNSFIQQNELLKGKFQSDFVVVRRSEDLGNHQRLVTANVISRHLDSEVGTHHAIDVKDLYATLSKKNLAIQSSDITTPSQLMHSLRFNLTFEQPIPDISYCIQNNPLMSKTSKFDSNKIFELGRRYGFMGRIFSHAIVNDNNILINSKNKNIKGWAFIPQEGNTLLSTIHAYLLQCGFKNHNKIINTINDKLIIKSW